MAPRAGRAAGWFDDEVPLLAGGASAVRRILRRARFSWPWWVVAAVVLTVGMTLWRGRVPSRYEVTLVLRVTEGSIRTPGTELGIGVLRTYITELAFSNSPLIDLMRRHPKAFPNVEQDATAALESLRSNVDIAISESDVVEDRAFGDPPRTARIAMTYKSGDPELAWKIAHELADLLVKATLNRQRAELARKEAAMKTAVSRAEAGLDAAGMSPRAASERVRAALTRFFTAEQQAASAEIAIRAADAKQAMRVEVIDPGRMPGPPDKSGRVPLFVATLLVALATIALLVGAFDPRVLDTQDLAAMGMTPLGWVPMGPASGRERSDAGEPPAPRV